MRLINRTRKVLLAIQEGCAEYVGTRAYIQDARDLFTRMGYTVHVQALANMGPGGTDYNGKFFEPNGSQGTTGKFHWDIDGDDYEFVVLPRYPGEDCDSGSSKVPEEWVRATRRKLPMLVEAIDDGREAHLIEVLGGDASERTTNTERICTYSGPNGDITVAEYTHTYPVLAAEAANVTAFVSVDEGGAADGHMVCWIHRPSGVAPVYVSAVQHTGVRRWMLPLLVAEAVRRGDIAAPPRRIPIFHDIDDIPSLPNTEAEIRAVLDVMNAHGMPVTWGIHAQDAGDNFAASPQAVKELTLDNQVARGGLVYPIDHYEDGFAGTVAATIDAYYQDLIGRMQGFGFVTGADAQQQDQWGYRYFNNHNVSRQALPLLRGYGHRVIRVDDSATLENSLRGRGFGAYRARVGGLEFIGYRAYGDNTAAQTNATQVTAVCRALLVYALISGYTLAIHGNDLYDGHDGGTGGGQWQFETVAALAAAMDNICEWKHPGDVF